MGRDYLNVYLPVGANGSLSIYVDGKLFQKTLSKDYYRDYDVYHDFEENEIGYEIQTSVSSNLLGLSVGKHTIKVVFSGDPRYRTISKTTTINANYFLSIEVKGPYIYKQSVNKAGSKIKIELPADAKIKPTVKIDGKKYKLKGVKKFDEYDQSKLYYELDISKLSVGTHSIKVTYKESRKYSSKSVNKKFKVKYDILAKFKSDNYDFDSKYGFDIKYGDGNCFSLKLPSNAKGKLSVYISSKKRSTGNLYKSERLKKGSASISLDDLNLGTYYAHVVYTGKDYKIKSMDCKIQYANQCNLSRDYELWGK